MSLSIENDNTIKIYPGPGKAALLAGDDVLFRAWTLLRPQTVSGFVTRAVVLETFAAIGLARTAWYRLLEHPRFDVYFTYDEKGERLFFRSLLALCEYYDTIPGSPVYADIKQFHRMQTFRAAVYATVFHKSARYVRRETIAKETGASATTQRTYEAIEGVDVSPNFVFAYVDAAGDLPIPPSLAEQNDSGYHTRLSNGEEVLLWQTVNAYRNENRNPAPTGSARKIARIVRRPADYGQCRERRTPYFLQSIKDRGSRSVVALYAGSAQRLLGSHFTGSVFMHFELVRNFGGS